ncbi:hypothetical protein ES703_55806 [subsurface metagenome]
MKFQQIGRVGELQSEGVNVYWVFNNNGYGYHISGFARGRSDTDSGYIFIERNFNQWLTLTLLRPVSQDGSPENAESVARGYNTITIDLGGRLGIITEAFLLKLA